MFANATRVPFLIDPLEPRRLLAADLTVSADVPTGLIEPGEDIQVSGTLANEGDTAAGPFVIDFILSTDETIGNEDDVTVEQINFPGLLAGQELTEEAEFTVPNLLLPGAYFLAVVVDSADEIDEDDEDNNVFVTSTAAFQVLDEEGILPVVGTDGDDTVIATRDDGTITVNVNGVATDYDASLVLGLAVVTGDGDDLVQIGDGFTDVYVLGGGGSDRIAGGDGNDVLVGGGSRDFIDGNGGNDSIFGHDGNDALQGQSGRDVIRGNEGDDYIVGGAQRDILTGGAGSDSLFAHGGNDHIDAADGAEDLIRGGIGSDTGEADGEDDEEDIEDLVTV